MPFANRISVVKEVQEEEEEFSRSYGKACNMNCACIKENGKSSANNNKCSVLDVKFNKQGLRCETFYYLN